MKATQTKYRKEQLIKGGHFKNTDAARAVLRDDTTYTVDEAVKAVNNFLGRKVK